MRLEQHDASSDRVWCPGFDDESVADGDWNEPQQGAYVILAVDRFLNGLARHTLSESEVEAVLKAKPIESGEVEAGSFIIYGSNEWFSINRALHFSNILVLFREGKARVIRSAGAGEGWRRELQERFIDFPR